jgi:hypothetical protein
MTTHQYLIDLFIWNKATHTLVAHFADLGFKSMKEVQGISRVQVIGRNHTAMFKSQGIHSDCVTFVPADEKEEKKIQKHPEGRWENLILCIRNWR